MAPHQERVVIEHRELEDKLEKLQAFIDTGNATFMALTEAERVRLGQQFMAMSLYSSILSQRIEAFSEAS